MSCVTSQSNLNLVNIRLHSILGEAIGDSWNLAVKSVGEAIHAINSLTQNKLFKFLDDKDKEGVKYQVLVDGRKFKHDGNINQENIRKTELAAINPDIKTIDIVPVLEGAEDVLTIIAGVILIAIGIWALPFGGWYAIAGGAAILAGIGLVAGGIINLLASPPKFEDFREIEQGGRASYLFNGPQNTTREGGPVPLCYGRLLIGSQVVSASYEISESPVDEQAITQ